MFCKLRVALLMFCKLRVALLMLANCVWHYSCLQAACGTTHVCKAFYDMVVRSRVVRVLHDLIKAFYDIGDSGTVLTAHFG